MTRWSAQQQAIFDWFADPTPTAGNLVVRARAGTGKTTTIIEGVERAPEDHILLCAFNKRIATELAGRLKNPRAGAQTLHAVGYAAVRRAWPGVRVASRPQDRADALTRMVTQPNTPDSIRRLVSRLHTLGREIAPHADAPDDLRDIALDFDCEPDSLFAQDPATRPYTLDFVLDAAVKAMDLAAREPPTTNTSGGIDFADMIYLPIRNGWLRPEYDMVVVDEAQDMTRSQLEIAQGVVTRAGRVCVVGDDRQAIYGFRGADSSSLDRLKLELAARELGLTTTYRCAARIVALAQELVPDIEAASTAPPGEIASLEGLEALLGAVSPAREDFVLSRTNAPLAAVAMALVRRQTRVRIAGRDIGQGLRSLVTRLRSRSIPDLLKALENWESREITRQLAAGRPERAPGIQDKAETIRVLCEDVAGPQELLARIDGLFADEGHGSVVCSSVHKAKGLEAPRVFVLSDTLYARFGDPQEETNIAYVAYTRAQEQLTFVTGAGRSG